MYRPMSQRTLALGAILPLVAWTWISVNGAWASEHSVALEGPNTIPSYCQEDSTLCGAAVGQMILEGYPNGIEHPFPQRCNTGTNCVWARIVAHRDDSGADWATDPDGLWGTLKELGSDPSVNWQIFDDTVAESLMFSITYWMTKRRFPTAILIDDGPNIPGESPIGSFNHWVVITGFTTDSDPTQQGSTAVNLQSIDIIDPLPSCSSYTSGGTPSHITGAAWYTHYLDAKGNLEGSKWNGKYVGIIEPPIKKGAAKAQKLPIKGTVVKQSVANEKVVNWLKNFDVTSRPFFAVLRSTVLLEPLLVNADNYGYYLFPLGYKRGQIVQGAILVNAYNGEFEQIGVFPRLIQYIEKSRAIKLALSHLCACQEEASARLVYYGSAQTQSRFMPLWQVTVKSGSVAYVDQQERVFTKLTPLPAGD